MSHDIISRMEAMQQRFRHLQLCYRETHVQKFDREIGLDQSSADSWRKRWEAELKDIPPESERQILRCAPPFDAQAEHEADLRYESRVDYESWQYDGPEEREDE